MFKDDRMMSMMTFVLVMLVLGTVIHRSDVVQRFLGNGPAALELKRDEVIVRANELTPIDVLLNDAGVTSLDRERLVVSQQPACGRVFVRDGKTHYLPAERCAGPQNFRYAITGRDGAEGEVIAVVRLDDPAQSQLTADAQRDFSTPTPGATRPVVARGGGDPSELPDQTAGATAASTAGVSAAPSVPRPQAGQAAGLAAQSANGDPAGGAAAADQPMAALQPLLQDGGGASAGLAALDTTPPPALPEPPPGDAAPPGPAQPQAATPPDPPAVPGAPGAPGAPAAPAIPAEPCTTPPALTLDIQHGAQTVVSVEAPCDAGQVALLSYDTLEFGIALDAAGKGGVSVPGLQPSSDAELRLPSGDGLAFDLPFADTERLDRVAIVWDAPVRIDLHAFEFGAQPGGAGHVSPGQPRSFDEARRHGGGYLLTYAPVGGAGQSIDIYSYWRRPGSATGVVKLMVDFTSRTGAGQPATCGRGDLARPDFRVLRAHGGRVSPPGKRRLAPLDCAAVAQADRLIGDAVDDMLILQE